MCLLQVPEPSRAALDAPQYCVTILPQEQHCNGNSHSISVRSGEGSGSNDTPTESEQAKAVRTAFDFSRLEAAAAGIASQHATLADPLSGSTPGAAFLL